MKILILFGHPAFQSSHINKRMLEELDKFKKGNQSLNYHAREFLRQVDQLSGEKIFDLGVKISPTKGRLIVKLDTDFHKDLTYSFAKDKPDHQILNCAYTMSKRRTSREVILISKDVNLRMKAKSVGLKTMDYIPDHIADLDMMYKGLHIEEGVSSQFIDDLYEKPFENETTHIEFSKELTPNEFLAGHN